MLSRASRLHAETGRGHDKRLDQRKIPVGRHVTVQKRAPAPGSRGVAWCCQARAKWSRRYRFGVQPRAQLSSDSGFAERKLLADAEEWCVEHAQRA